MQNIQKNKYISDPYKFKFPLTNFFHRSKIQLLNKKELMKTIKLVENYYENHFPKIIIDHKPNHTYKIFNYLTDRSISMGRNPNAIKKLYIKKINVFVNKHQPILFTVVQFAFKIPNKLKTNRKTPDLGELIFLIQLAKICKDIKKIYKPGAKIIILGESSVFYKTVNIQKKEAKTYYNIIKEWIKVYHLNNYLKIYDLKILQSKIPNFNKELEGNLQILKSGWEKNNKDIKKEIKNIAKTLFLSINTRKYPLNTLMDIYRNKINKVSNLRKNIYEKALEKSFYYLAYHKTIETSQLSKIIFPNSIKLSFTHGTNKLSLYPINKYSKLYPYHGVPVISSSGLFKIEYLIELKRSKNIALKFKNEKEPFYYLHY